MLPPPEMTAERLAEFMSELELGEYRMEIVSAASPFLTPEGGAVITLPGTGRVVTFWPAKKNSLPHG